MNVCLNRKKMTGIIIKVFVPMATNNKWYAVTCYRNKLIETKIQQLYDKYYSILVKHTLVQCNAYLSKSDEAESLEFCESIQQNHVAEINP